MLKLLIFTVIIATASAWDPSLKIAEKIAIPHHIRHGYEYPYINIAQMMNRGGGAVRPGFSQQLQPQPSPFEVARPQSQGFRQQLQPIAPNRGFQAQPFQQSQGGFSSSPVRQTRFFERFNGNSRPEFGTARSNTFFNRRQS